MIGSAGDARGTRIRAAGGLCALLLSLLGCGAYDPALLSAHRAALGADGAPADGGNTGANADGGMQDGATAPQSSSDASVAASDASVPPSDAAIMDGASEASTSAPDAADTSASDAGSAGDAAPPADAGCTGTDTDGDGTPDCRDGCPNDPDKTDPGVCGCGFPDVTDGCLGLRSALLHRYSFDGQGTTVTDSKGTADGTVVQTQLDGSGALTLAGGTPVQYVSLPANLLSTQTDATLEAWVSWSGGNSWQRIFDFGNYTSSGQTTTGKTYLFLTPQSGGSSSTLHVTYSSNGTSAERTAAASAALSTSGMHHTVVVVDDQNDALSLYLDGSQVGTTSYTGHLSSLNDVNCWLGRSQFSADPGFSGTFYEVRIYGAALGAAQITTSFQAGPKAGFF